MSSRNSVRYQSPKNTAPTVLAVLRAIEARHAIVRGRRPAVTWELGSAGRAPGPLAEPHNYPTAPAVRRAAPGTGVRVGREWCEKLRALARMGPTLRRATVACHCNESRSKSNSARKDTALNINYNESLDSDLVGMDKLELAGMPNAIRLSGIFILGLATFASLFGVMFSRRDAPPPARVVRLPEFQPRVVVAPEPEEVVTEKAQKTALKAADTAAHKAMKRDDKGKLRPHVIASKRRVLDRPRHTHEPHQPTHGVNTSRRIW
jgi:hypothetical protein